MIFRVFSPQHYVILMLSNLASTDIWSRTRVMHWWRICWRWNVSWGENRISWKRG